MSACELFRTHVLFLLNSQERGCIYLQGRTSPGETLRAYFQLLNDVTLWVCDPVIPKNYLMKIEIDPNRFTSNSKRK